MVASLGSKETSAETGEFLTKTLNNAPEWHTLRELLSDLQGKTTSNADLLRLINKVKASIDAMRQDYREAIPDELTKQFTRKLTREEWSTAFLGMGQTDIMAIGAASAQDLMKDPSSLDQRIQDEEEKLTSLNSVLDDRYKAKAKALAIYMTGGGNTSRNLLRNAHAIANLFGENQAGVTVTPELERTIERLVALYAYREIGPDARATLAQLMSEEAGGMRVLSNYLEKNRAMEANRQSHGGGTNEIALKNGWQGFIPSLKQQGSSVIVKDDSEHDTLVSQGYVRVGDYVGDRNEGYRGSRGIYQSTVAGRNAFRQGVAQTVHETYQGVDPRTGQSSGDKTAGVFRGTKATRLARAIRSSAPGTFDGLAPGEYLMPILDADGNVTGYERPISPNGGLLAFRVSIEKSRTLGL